MTSFASWLRGKYVGWRQNKIGREGSVAAFARLFGAPQPLMVEWMLEDGKVPTAAKYISALAAFFGPEVYTVLGLQEPEDLIAILPPYYRSRLESAVSEVRQVLLDKGLSPDDPDAREIVDAILKKYGISITDLHT